MEISTLMEIVQTRIKASENNPTAKSFLFELYKVLEEYKQMKEGEK